MNTNLFFSEGSDLQELQFAAGLPSPDTLAPVSDHPDGRISLAGADGTVIAHAGLWWREALSFKEGRIGTIGGFAATDGDAARRLLEAAMEPLRQADCQIVVGPMNGNTWRRHRFVVGSDGRGPFLLEPRNPEEYPGWWQAAGFGVLSRYSSSAMPLDGRETLPPAAARRLDKSGVTVRVIRTEAFEDELRIIHGISLKAFARNFLYTPLGEVEFIAAYQKVRGWIDPAFVLIAERRGEPCGFVFGIEDHEARGRGAKPAVIVKTLAVDPEAKCPGLGSLLVDGIHRAARDKGFSEAIHALQHETNSSLKITGRHQGEVFRRYALFSKLP